VALSFHPNKNMTTGEGGCLVMNTAAEAKLFEKLRLQGVTRLPDGTYDCDILGGKANLTDIAAAIGMGQIARLDEANTRRRALAHLYFSHLDGTDLGLPPADFAQSNWHMFQILLPERLASHRPLVMEQLKAEGIGSGVHYPPIHMTTLYQQLGWRRGDLPHTESVAARILTLPLFAHMPECNVDRVCEALLMIIRRL
jgi:dTDP-4-amino-4,6-dideoxygalactose transaminase